MAGPAAKIEVMTTLMSLHTQQARWSYNIGHEELEKGWASFNDPTQSKCSAVLILARKRKHARRFRSE